MKYCKKGGLMKGGMGYAAMTKMKPDAKMMKHVSKPGKFKKGGRVKKK